MKRQHRTVPALTVLGVLASGQVMAATNVDVELETRTQVSDNFYYQDQAEQQVNTFVVASDVSVLNKGRVLESQFELGAEATANSKSDADNYADYSGGVQFLTSVGASQFIFGGSFQRGHDPFGTARTEGQANLDQDLDLWRQSALRLGWRRHGEFKGSIFSELNLTQIRREYTSNRDSTRTLDRDLLTGSALLGYNLTSKTGLFGNVFHTDIEFDDDDTGIIRSGTATGFALGLRWRATAKTTGEFRYGRVEREQDVTGNTFDAAFWQASVLWNASRTDEFRLSTEQAFLASYLTTAEFIDAQTHRITWRHSWNRNLSSSLSGSFRRQDFVRTSGTDDVTSARLQLNYELDRDFTVYGRFESETRDSTRANRDYERNQAVLGLTMNLN